MHRAVVFVGRTFEQLVGGALRAAVHRVDKSALGPRLSCVYELRPAPGNML